MTADNLVEIARTFGVPLTLTVAFLWFVWPFLTHQLEAARTDARTEREERTTAFMGMLREQDERAKVERENARMAFVEALRHRDETCASSDAQFAATLHHVAEALSDIRRHLPAARKRKTA